MFVDSNIHATPKIRDLPDLWGTYNSASFPIILAATGTEHWVDMNHVSQVTKVMQLSPREPVLMSGYALLHNALMTSL
jgi:hypothetical protein